MSHRELHDEDRRMEVREEVQSVGEDVHERHTFREEAYGPAVKVPEHEVVHDEGMAHARLSRESSLEREEVHSSLEDLASQRLLPDLEEVNRKWELSDGSYSGS